MKVGFEVVKEGIPQKDDEIQFFHRLGHYFGIKENFKNTKKTWFSFKTEFEFIYFYKVYWTIIPTVQIAQ